MSAEFDPRATCGPDCPLNGSDFDELGRVPQMRVEMCPRSKVVDKGVNEAVGRFIVRTCPAWLGPDEVIIETEIGDKYLASE